MKPRVGSEAARLGGEVCSRCHLAGSIAGHRARRPVSMAAAPVTFGDSQVLLRRTTPEGAKTADGRISRRHEACKYTMSPCGLGQYAWGDLRHIFASLYSKALKL